MYRERNELDTDLVWSPNGGPHNAQTLDMPVPITVLSTMPSTHDGVTPSQASPSYGVFRVRQKDFAFDGTTILIVEFYIIEVFMS